MGDDKADVIGLTDIVKRYGKFQALDRVSLSVQRGSVHSIIGPNGAGKTTLLQVLSGIVKPDFGRVYVAGVDVSRWSSDRRAKSGLGRSFQVAQLFEDMSALGNVAIAASVSRRRRMIKMVSTLRKTELESAKEALEACGLGSVVDRKVVELPHGDRKLVELAMVIANESQYLVLDEPTAGMSASETKFTADVIQWLVKEKGMTALLIEHDLETVRRISDMVTALDRGTKVFSGTPEEMYSSEELRSAYFGRE